MPGFLLGIVYVNFIARKYMAEPGIFSDFFLNQFQSVSIDVKEYIWYLLRLRAVPILALAGLLLYKSRKSRRCPVPHLDGHFSGNPDFRGSIEHGD